MTIYRQSCQKVAGCHQKSPPTWLELTGYSAWHFFMDGFFKIKYPWTGHLLWQLTPLLQNFLTTLIQSGGSCSVSYYYTVVVTNMNYKLICISQWKRAVSHANSTRVANCEPVTSKHTRLRFVKLDALTNDLFVRFSPLLWSYWSKLKIFISVEKNW